MESKLVVNTFLKWNQRTIIISAVILGLLIGITSVVFSPLIALAGVSIIFGIVLFFYRPEISLLAILFITSGIIYESDLPLLPIGIGSLHIPDILLLGVLVILVFKALVEPDFKLISSPMNWWVVFYLGFLLLSTLIAALYNQVDFHEGIREFRVLSYYLAFFIVINLVQRKKQLRWLIDGIIWLATLVAFAMSLQFLLGISLPFLPDRVEALRTGETVYTDITRILPPGQSVIVTALILLICQLIVNPKAKNKVILLLQCAMIGFAVIITFTRSFWVQVALAVFVLAVVARKAERRRLINYALLVLLALAVLLILSYSNPSARYAQLTLATVERLGTLFEVDTLSEDSLEWRSVENSYVWPQVQKHPLLGLGLGAKYRTWDHRIDYEERTWFDARYYIHNAHFWILLKGGIASYGCLVVMSFIFLYRGFKYWYKVQDAEMRYWVLGFTLVYLGVVIGAIYNPIFTQWYWTPLIGSCLE